MMDVEFTFDVQVLIALLTVIALIFLDVALGIMVAAKEGTFDPHKLPQFLQKSIIPFVGGLIILAAGAYVYEPLKGFFFFATALLIPKFFSDIKNKGFRLFGLGGLSPGGTE